MKQSQAFAAFRTSLITDKTHAILNELVPEFNSCCEDIRRKVETDFETYHNRAKADNFRKTLVYDLVLYRQQILNDVQKDLNKAIDQRLLTDGAEVQQSTEDRNGKLKPILKATFPDGSQARVPQNLWIDYKLFDRV